MGALPRLHPRMSPSWNRELAINADVLSWAQQQCPRDHGCAAGGAFLSLTIPQATALVDKMASNQGWNEERTQTRKRGGGMHHLKEVDMLSAKLDLLMKKLDDRAGDKK